MSLLFVNKTGFLRPNIFQAIALLLLVMLSWSLVGAEKTLQFELAPRVELQLKDPRLGELAGKLDINSLNKLATNPNAQFLYDSGTGHINIVQNVEGKLLRITVPRDTFKIISVGPIQERNLINSITAGRFIPIGEQFEEASQLDIYMMRVQP